MARFTKSDIRTHSEGYGRGAVPAVNVKIHDIGDVDALARRVAVDNGADYPEEFVRHVARLSEAERDHFWEYAITDGWEYLQESVNAERVFDRDVEVCSEGRSGGWAVVRGISDWWGDVDTWDAVKVKKWGKFARFARESADGVAYDWLGLIWINDYAREGGEPEAQTWPGMD